MSKLCRTFVLAAVAAAATTTSQDSSSLLAQQQGLPLAAELPSSLFGKDSASPVYVRDSAVAVEKLALGERLERLKEWTKAADVYQEVLVTLADRVVPSQLDAEQKIYQYTSVARAVQERLSRWPDEGLNVYRTRYETEARALFDGTAAGARADATDSARAARLHQVLSLYFVTDAGRDAGLELVDTDLLDGEFAAAAWTGDRLLTWHPNLAAERPALLFRTAIAYHLAGNASLAAERLARLKSDFPDAAGTVAGSEVVLSTALAEALARDPALPKLPTAASANAAPADADLGDSWPMPYGSPDRARLLPGGVLGGARIFGIDIRPTFPRSLTRRPDAMQAIVEERRRGLAAGELTGIFPAVDGNELFFHDNARVYAVSLDSGFPLPGWAETYAGTARPGDASAGASNGGGGGTASNDGRYVLPNAIATPKETQQTLCVTRDSVFAVLGQTDLTAAALERQNGRPLADARLVCLDRATGAPRWTASSASLPVPANPAAPAGGDAPGNQRNVVEPPETRRLEFAGSPLVVGDAVFIVARSARFSQIQETRLVCLDADDGRLRWTSYLASGGGGGPIYEPEIDDGNSAAPQLSYAAGRVYVLTNLGALAAVDAYDGTIAWLDLYPRDSSAAEERQQFINRLGGRALRSADRPTGRPWSVNPVIVTQNKVFVFPADSKHVLIYDAGTGVESTRIDSTQRDLRDQNASSRTAASDVARMMLGVVDDKLVLASGNGLLAVKWRDFDERKPRPEKLAWASSSLSRASDGGADAIRGRPFLTRDSVFVPLGWGVARLSVAKGLLDATFPPANGDANAARAAAAAPAAGADDLAMTSGNLLVTGQHLVIAGPQRVEVYTDLALAQGRLEREVERQPDSVEPRLRLAEVLFTAGDSAAALARVDEAVARLGGPGAMRPGSARDRVFTAAMTFAGRLAAGSRERAAAMYERAAGAASTPSQQIAWRTARAALARVANDPTTEVRLFQQILADPVLRETRVGASAGGGGGSSGVADSLSADAGVKLPAGAAAERGIAAAVARSAAGCDAYAEFDRAATAALEKLGSAATPAAFLDIAATYPNAAAAPRALVAAAAAYDARRQPPSRRRRSSAARRAVSER